jgi:hypothetical protein
LQKAPDRKVQRVQIRQIWRPICPGLEFRHVFSQELPGGPGSVGWRQIMQEDTSLIVHCKENKKLNYCNLSLIIIFYTYVFHVRNVF